MLEQLVDLELVHKAIHQVVYVFHPLVVEEEGLMALNVVLLEVLVVVEPTEVLEEQEIHQM